MNIRNRNLLIALAGLGILSASATSSAQMGTSVAQPIRVEIGGFFPSSTDVTDTLKKTALYGGVSYDLYSAGAKTSSPMLAGIYVDASYNSNGGLHLTQVGVGVDGRVYASVSSLGQFYVGAGVGAYFLNANGFFGSSNNTRIGGKVFVGYELTQGFYVEGGYTLITDVDGVNPSGFMAAIGYKF